MKKKPRIFLSRQEVHKLIDLWAENIDQLRGKFRNKEIYKNMSLELRKRHRLTLNYNEIRIRINNLKKQFKIEKNNELSGRGTPTWPYYQKLEQILEEGNSNRLEETYTPEDTDTPKHSTGESFPIPQLIEELSDEDVASGSTKTTHKRKWYEEEFLRIAKEEQQNMKKYFKHSLENDEKIIKLLQNNNDLLSQILNKA